MCVKKPLLTKRTVDRRCISECDSEESAREGEEGSEGVLALRGRRGAEGMLIAMMRLGEVCGEAVRAPHQPRRAARSKRRCRRIREEDLPWLRAGLWRTAPEEGSAHSGQGSAGRRLRGTGWRHEIYGWKSV